ncbi:MAG: haloacid dehalogenase-like hydrolase, partial [Pseudomonadota bacterium]
MPSDVTELAIFDLDYTLTCQGTWGRFVRRAMKGQALGVPALLCVAGWTQMWYKQGAVPRIAVKTAMMRQSMVGRTRQDLETVADELVADDLKNGLRPRVLQAFRDHQDAGHTVLIASAAVDLLVERYCEALRADGQVSTR